MHLIYSITRTIPSHIQFFNHLYLMLLSSNLDCYLVFPRTSQLYCYTSYLVFSLPSTTLLLLLITSFVSITRLSHRSLYFLQSLRRYFHYTLFLYSLFFLLHFSVILYFIRPKISRNILQSSIKNLFSSNFFSFQVKDPYSIILVVLRL